MITEEWAKNPKAKVKVECQFCHAKHSVEAMLREEPFPVSGKALATEVLLVCPTCQGRRHSYYMTPELRSVQEILHLALQRYNKSHSSQDFEEYRKAQKQYQRAFDL